MRFFTRQPGGRPSYRLLALAAAPILWLLLATPGRTGADARDEPPPRPKGGPARVISTPDVQPATVLVPTLSSREALSNTRNPFAFVAREAPPPPRPPAPVVPPPAPPPDLPPGVELIGVATATRSDGRIERTAIIAGPAGALFFVRDGEGVTARYRVESVLQDTALLVDGATGTSFRLALR